MAGIGLHLAAAADFLVLADDARVWEPFAQRGFTPTPVAPGCCPGWWDWPGPGSC